jgi:hypothetical protein
VEGLFKKGGADFNVRNFTQIWCRAVFSGDQFAASGRHFKVFGCINF